MQKVYQKRIMRGVNLTCVNAIKFKTGCISVTLMTRLDKKTASMNAVLPYVLRRGTAGCPDMEALSAVLDDLYGARIVPVVRKKGEVQCIGFYADFPDDAFVPGTGNILEKTAKLMGEMLLSPATSGGRLKAEYVDSERRNLMDDIRAEINDKRLYAARRLTEHMFKGESYGVGKLGTLADASKISVQTLTKHYKELIASSAIEIFYCGAEEPEKVEHIMREALAALPRVGDCEIPQTAVSTKNWEAQPRYFSEKLDVTQGKLVMGYRLGEAMKNPNHAAFMVFNAVFGGAATSKLFMNVREKLSLCYEISSGLDRHKGVMVVSSGIEFSKYDEALSEITKQLEAVKNGELEDWELDGAKKAVMTAIYSSIDEPVGLESMYLDRTMLGLTAKPSELAALVSEVTAQDVAEIASCVRLDSIFFLTGEDEDA
ncbi:MAG: EF-P 5-aminopentanol modification-associated protein YfmF [Oscillospiraceae bacterium]